VKRRFILLWLLLLPAFALQAGIEGRAVIEDRIGGRTVHVLANTLRVRFVPGIARTPADAQQNLPEGCSVVYHFAPRNPSPSKALRLGARRVDSPADQLMRTFAIEYDGQVSPYAMAQKIKSASPQLDVVEPWYVPMPHAIPNDPRVSQQLFLTVIRAYTAWDKEQGGADVVIAVSDGGIDQTHEDLRGSLWTNTKEIPNNNTDDDGNGQVDDYQGCNLSWADDGTTPGVTANSTSSHGTEVSGLAAATQNNGVGISGVGAKCKLFPIKAGSTKEKGLVYAYPSLIYAADMGFDVVNASWGVTAPYSSIDQSVIDYCISKNMAVVCSSGNGGDVYENFPAAYRGVMGVGETSLDDLMTANTAYGVNTDVLAPGRNALSTSSGNSYTNGLSGTSYAAPMGAGMVALIRHRYPMLSAMQAMEFARRCTEDVSSLQPQYGTLIPGRIDLQKIVDLDPMSAPSVRIITTTARHTNGNIASRYTDGDTLLFEFEITNFLGAITGLRCLPYIARANGWDVSLLDAQSPRMSLGTNASTTVGPFRLVMHATASAPLVLGLRFTNDTTYEDRDLLNWRRSLNGVTMQNERLAYSIFDNGWFGYSDETDRLGVGFQYKPGEDVMNFQSGFVVTESDIQVVSAYLNPVAGSDFTSLQRFEKPDTSTGRIQAPFGLDVTLACRFPSQWGTTTVITVTLKNSSSSAFKNLSSGFFFDWDIGYAGRNNRARLCPEAIPSTFAQIAAAAEQISRDGLPVVVVCGVNANVPPSEASPQAAGFSYADRIVGGSMSNETKIELLKSGTSVQTTTPDDIASFIGMRYAKDLSPGEERSYTIVIGVGDTEAEAQTAVREILLNPTSVPDSENDDCRVVPNPANEQVRVLHGDNTYRIDVIDLAGHVVAGADVQQGTLFTTIATSSLGSGVYVVRVWSSNCVLSRRLVINE